MNIGLFINRIRLYSLYKYLVLEDELLSQDHNLFIFTSQIFYNFLISSIDSFQNENIYNNFCQRVKNLKFVIIDEGVFKNEELENNQDLKNKFDNIDLLVLSIDSRHIINIHPSIIDKVICYKFRICNDIRFHHFLKYDNKNPISLLLPSKIYENHFVVKKMINFYNWEINKIDFVRPIEVCDIPNSYINFCQDDIRNKYKIDENKKTLLYYVSPFSDQKGKTKERKIIDFILNNEEVKSKYQIFLAQKPYSDIDFDEYSQYNIDFFDYDYLMRNEIDGILGGISTIIRESLLYEKPVLYFYKDNFEICIKKKKIISIEKIYSINFKKNISMLDQIEGKFCDLQKDNLCQKLDNMFLKSYDFDEKRDLWFSKKLLIDKLNENIQKQI